LARPDSPTAFRSKINVAGVSDDLGVRLAA
jgi:hypothetical protein